MLRGQGYAVSEASGPWSALEQIERHPARFSLLVADVVMPEMSGVELAAAAQRINPQLPVLFMTGYEPGPFERAEDSQVLPKPFTPAQLMGAVGRALSQPRRAALP